MKVLKGFAAVLFSFILFIAVLVFGILLTVNSTVMNPDFIKSRIDSIELTELANEIVDTDSSPESEEVFDIIKDIIPKVEPDLKEHLGVAVDSVYDYLLDKKDDPEIKKTIGDSVLNTEFVDSILDDISLPELVEIMGETGEGEEEMPEEFMTAIKDVVTEMEPQIKEKVSEILAPVFAYILDESQDLDMKTTLRETVLNEEFVVPLIESLDLSAISQELITEQITEQIPDELAYLTDYIEPAVDAIEPAVKEQLQEAAGPFLDYLMGYTNDLSIYISLDVVIDTLEEALKDELVTSPPSEFAGWTRSEIEQHFDDSLIGQVSDFLPDTFEIDETIIGSEVVGSFSDAIVDIENSIADAKYEFDSAIADVEEPLRDAKQYISWFKLGYIISLAVIGVMALLIILIFRNVKSSSMTIGIPLFICGIIEYVGVMIGKSFLEDTVSTLDIPGGMENWVYDLVKSAAQPLEMYGLGLLVAGLILIIVSIVYRRGGKKEEIPVVVEVPETPVVPETPETTE
ncbi:MAG: hypothetical protein JW712_03290 [Dehalococcoidales bacterium]|nr:hypothetical protein [Dehalococcoidales bacterium]